ncbi:hypothetical protein POP12_129 [Pectobacterium phage POP12]|nr:hypothetical protein POP12_129 [Pectobacterium phage POP12]
MSNKQKPIAWLNDAYLGRGVVEGEVSEEFGDAPGMIPVYREPYGFPIYQVREKKGHGNISSWSEVPYKNYLVIKNNLIDWETRVLYFIPERN